MGGRFEVVELRDQTLPMFFVVGRQPSSEQALRNSSAAPNTYSCEWLFAFGGNWKRYFRDTRLHNIQGIAVSIARNEYGGKKTSLEKKMSTKGKG